MDHASEPADMEIKKSMTSRPQPSSNCVGRTGPQLEQQPGKRSSQNYQKHV